MSSRRFLQTVTILVCIMVIELIFFRSIGVRDFSHSNSFLFLLFLSLVIVSLIIQFVLLRYFIKINYSKEKRTFINLVNVVQFIIMFLIGISMFNIAPHLDIPFISTLELNHILSSIVSISYGLAIFSLVLGSFRFFRYYMSKRKLFSLLYGLSFSLLVINAVLNLARIDIQLGYFIVLPISVCGLFEATQSCAGINYLVFLSLIISTLLLWASAVFRMYTYKHRLGEKIWSVILMPFSFLIAILFIIQPSFVAGMLGEENRSFVIVILFPIMSYFLLRFIPSYAFGASFWITRTLVSNAKEQNATIVGGAGLFLYLITMNQTVTTFPSFVQDFIPFGIIALSMVGLFACLINTIDIENDLN